MAFSDCDWYVYRRINRLYCLPQIKIKSTRFTRIRHYGTEIFFRCCRSDQGTFVDRALTDQSANFLRVACFLLADSCLAPQSVETFVRSSPRRCSCHTHRQVFRNVITLYCDVQRIKGEPLSSLLLQPLYRHKPSSTLLTLRATLLSFPQSKCRNSSHFQTRFLDA